MSKITNDGLTRSGRRCITAIPAWQQWASMGYKLSQQQRSSYVALSAGRSGAATDTSETTTLCLSGTITAVTAVMMTATYHWTHTQHTFTDSLKLFHVVQDVVISRHRQCCTNGNHRTAGPPYFTRPSTIITTITILSHWLTWLSTTFGAWKRSMFLRFLASANHYDFNLFDLFGQWNETDFTDAKVTHVSRK